MQDLLTALAAAGSGTLRVANRATDAEAFKAAMEDCMQQAQNLLVCCYACVIVQQCGLYDKRHCQCCPFMGCTIDTSLLRRHLMHCCKAGCPLVSELP